MRASGFRPLAAAFALLPLGVLAQTINLNPTDDVWVYHHAADPTGGAYMAAWGDGTTDLDSNNPPGDNFSYSYLKFDLGAAFDPSKTYTVTSAVLTVYQFSNAGYTKDQANATPLLARTLGDNWNEATYTFSSSLPTPGNQLGQGDMSNYDVTKDFAIPTNLLGAGQSTMDSFFNAAVKGSGKINLALTSKMNPGGPTGTAFYLLWTKEGVPSDIEQLSITAKAVPEPGTLVGLAPAALMLLAVRKRRTPSIRRFR